MIIDELTDYALPLIKIERLAKEIHDQCLVHKFDEAREGALRLGVETSVLKHILTLMKEKHEDTQNNPRRQSTL
jgi:hypothetical protein